MGYPDDAGEHAGPQPSREDFEAAEALIARMPDAPAKGTPEYNSLLAHCVAAVAAYGEDGAAMRLGLREPQGRAEELARAAHTGAITTDQYRQQFKAHTERQVDHEMLRTFCDDWERQLTAYGDMLQAVVRIATDQRDIDGRAALKREPEVDTAVERMNAKSGLFPEELETVYRFLTELRSERGEPVRCGRFSGDSAHWLAACVLDHALKAWEEDKRIAHRSRTDPAYTYSTTASSLFYECWIEPGALPKPNDLASLLRLERAQAERALQDREQAGAAPASEPGSPSLASGNASAGGGERDSGEAAGEVALTDAEVAMLRHLDANRARRLKRADLSPPEPVPGNEKAQRKILNRLAELGLIEAEPRQPVRILVAGTRWLEQHAAGERR